MEVSVRIPEPNKKAGVCYAVTNEGVELPVIDVTHPQFAINLTAGELAAQKAKFMRDVERGTWMPPFLHRLLPRFFLRKSVLMQGIRKGSDRFLSGMNTYLLKIGPDNLGAAYIGRGDRRIASSFPVVSVRLRLQEASRMIAQGFAGPLSARPGAPLHLVNIGGGHAADSLNSLIVARAADARLLSGRKILILVLDLEADAPDFGRRALAALLAPGAPLHGLDVAFSHVRYDWSQPAALLPVIRGLGTAEAVVGLSTEGALLSTAPTGTSSLIWRCCAGRPRATRRSPAASPGNAPSSGGTITRRGFPSCPAGCPGSAPWRSRRDGPSRRRSRAPSATWSASPGSRAAPPPHMEWSAIRLPSVSSITARKPNGPMDSLGWRIFPPLGSTAPIASSRRPWTFR